jgi:manganese transport protein
MGVFVNPTWLKILAWAVTVIIILLNVYLLIQTVTTL